MKQGWQINRNRSGVLRLNRNQHQQARYSLDDLLLFWQ